MNKSQFLYVTYIRTTPEKLWNALIDPDFNKKYWFNMHLESHWGPGAEWRLMFPDGRVADMGEVLEFEPHRRLVLKWRNEFKPELTAEGFARMTCTLEPEEGAVKLTILHEMERENSLVIKAVSGGWPKILSSLKSLLETGEAMPTIHASAKAA